MNYGFIGAGAIAQALVRRLTAVGESDVVLSNSREPETLALLAKQLGVVDGGRRVIFYSGDEDGALTTVGLIIQRLGFAGVPLGDLGTGGRLHQFPGGPLPARDFIEHR
jgi:predicted dinucleotide-binding enzyme